MAVSRPVAGLFNFSQQGIYYTVMILTVFSCVLFIKIHNATIITGVLRAGGDTKFALFAEISCVWLIGVPVAFFCALYLEWPIYLVVLAIQLEEVVKMFILHGRYRSQKWVRNLVSHL
jgi:Na+-driven multidrug efflux pump